MNLPKWMFEGIVTEALKDKYSSVYNLVSEEEYDYLGSPLFIAWLYTQAVIQGIDLSEYYESQWFVKYMIEQYRIFSTSIPDYEIGRWYKSKVVDRYYLFESIIENEESVIVIFEDDCRICRNVNNDKMYYYLDRQLELIADNREIEKIKDRLCKFKNQEVLNLNKYQHKVNELDKVLGLVKYDN